MLQWLTQIWGLKDVSNFSSTTLKSQLSGSPLDVVLQLACNYRPIPLLPVFPKILERLMYNRLYNFLAEHNILSTNQFCVRNKYSTFFLALMDLVDNIILSKHIDEVNYSITFFLDSSTVFATIHHAILFDKLCRYGFKRRNTECVQTLFK